MAVISTATQHVMSTDYGLTTQERSRSRQITVLDRQSGLVYSIIYVTAAYD